MTHSLSDNTKKIIVKDFLNDVLKFCQCHEKLPPVSWIQLELIWSGAVPGVNTGHGGASEDNIIVALLHTAKDEVKQPANTAPAPQVMTQSQSGGW